MKWSDFTFSQAIAKVTNMMGQFFILINQVTSQFFLAPKRPTYPHGGATPTTGKLPATISFIFDRQEEALVSDAGRGGGFPSGGWKGIFNDKNIKFSLSLINFTWNTAPTFGSSGQMSLANALQLQADGFEIESHLRSNDVPNADYEQAINVLQTIKDIQTGLGFDVKNGNWFQGASSAAYRSAAKKIYRSAGAVRSGDEIIKPINQFNFRRETLDQVLTESNYNLWVSQVDDAVANGYPFVFYGHAYVDGWYDTKYDDNGNEDANGEFGWQKIVKLIDYIQALPGYDDISHANPVIITTINEMIDLHGNALDAGSPRRKNDVLQPDSNDYTRVSSSGEFASSKTDPVVDNTRFGSTGVKISSFDSNITRNSGTVTTTVGHNAGGNSAASTAVFVGSNSGLNSTADNGTAIGADSLRGCSGARGVGVGRFAGRNRTGVDFVDIGWSAGDNNIGTRNINIGREAGEGAVASDSVNIGHNAGKSGTGNRNINIGRESGKDSIFGNVISLGYIPDEIPFSNVFIVHHSTSSPIPFLSGDMEHGGIAIGAPSTTNKLADARIGANRFTFYLDEATDKLHVRVKYADGTTIKVGEVALV